MKKINDKVGRDEICLFFVDSYAENNRLQGIYARIGRIKIGCINVKRVKIDKYNTKIAGTRNVGFFIVWKRDSFLGLTRP